MHIAMVLASVGEGGLEKHVRELSLSLIREGHQVTVIADAHFLSSLATEVCGVALNMQRSRWHPLLCWQLWRTLQHLQADVVHAHANKATALLARIRRWLRVPMVATLHNLKHSTREYLAMDAVIAVSHALAKTLQHPDVHVVYHGVMHAPAVIQQPPAGFTLCAVGRLVDAKGLDILLEAVDGLPLQLLIAGEGPARPMLAQRISKLAPATQVRLLGHQTNIPALLATSHGLVIASRREGFAYVCAEALLQHVPVIATEVPVANEVLPAPWLVPVGDVAALRAAIVQAMQAPQQWRESQRAAFFLAERQFTMAAMTQSTLNIYHAVHRPA